LDCGSTELVNSSVYCLQLERANVTSMIRGAGVEVMSHNKVKSSYNVPQLPMVDTSVGSPGREPLNNNKHQHCLSRHSRAVGKSETTHTNATSLQQEHARFLRARDVTQDHFSQPPSHDSHGAGPAMPRGKHQVDSSTSSSNRPKHQHRQSPVAPQLPTGEKKSR